MAYATGPNSGSVKPQGGDKAALFKVNVGICFRAQALTAALGSAKPQGGDKAALFKGKCKFDFSKVRFGKR